MALPQKLFFVFLIFIASLIFTAWQRLPELHLNNDILALFPQDDSNNNEQHAKTHSAKLFSQYATNKVLFLIGHNQFNHAVSAAAQFSATLSQSTIFEEVEFKRSPKAYQALAQLYRAHSPSLLSHEALAQLQNAPETFIQKRLRQLYTSPAFLSSEAFEFDPLGTSDLFLQSNFSGATGPFYLEQEYLTLKANDLYYILVQAQLTDSAFSLNTQNHVSAQILQAENTLLAQHPDVSILKDGAIFFATSGAEQAQSEISTVGLGSLIGIVILLIAAFFSLRVLSLCMLPTAIGILTGLLICELVFCEVHLIALVFGASLIGVSIDYSFHFFSTRLFLKKNWSPLRAIQELRWGLSLGVITSASAYMSFLFSGFPGFQQIAVFSAAGLVGAYITVLFCFPVLFSRPARSSAIFEWMRPRLFAYVNNINRYAKNSHIQILLALVILLSLSVIAFKLEPQDDIRSMQSIDPSLLEEHLKVKELTEQNIAQSFLLVKGATDEQLLQNLEQVQQGLNTLSQQHYSLSHWLPSVRSQSDNLELVRNTVVESGLLNQFFQQMQFNTDAQRRWLQKFNHEISHPLNIENGLAHVQALVDQPWYFEFADEVYSIVILDNIINTDDIEELADTNTNIFWINHIAQTNTMLETYRKRSTLVLGMAFAAVFSLLFLRYGFMAASFVILPPAFACTVSCALLIIFGQSISLFNIMALVLILGIGIDYSIFMRESKADAGTNFFAISLSSITTLLSFGLLALSKTHAISSFGLTILIGISLCYLLTPISLIHSLSQPLTHRLSSLATKKKEL